METLATLLRAYPFQDLTPAELEPLLPRFSRHEYRRGQAVWRQGDTADALWFVMAGAVQGIHGNSRGDAVVTMLYGPGESLGEIGLFLPDAIRGVSCVAIEASALLSLEREPLLRFLQSHPAALRRMLESLSIAAASQSLAFRELAFRDVRSRVAWRLLNLAATHGERAAEGILITLPLPQAVLAGMVAASRENVNRALSGLIAAGDIAQAGGHITILRPDELRAVAGVENSTDRFA